MTVDWMRPWLCKHVKFAILSLRLSLCRAVARGRAPRRYLVSAYLPHILYNRHNRVHVSSLLGARWVRGDLHIHYLNLIY